ncbi:hypothetical protein NBRC116493_21880 [Aurantivibrio infirmus]
MLTIKMVIRRIVCLALPCSLLGLSNIALAQINGLQCSAPPRINCPESNCPRDAMANRGPVVDEKTGRSYYLDYPCDLKPGEKLTFILNIHGAGSIATWQRHYFPAVDAKEKYRLIVATPTALIDDPAPRRWAAEADDEHLHNIVDFVLEKFGKENIERFWLAGHSQGGMTSRRIVCSDYFADKVDGFFSLSGGRVGSPLRVREGRPTPPPLTCDFSHIYTTGELERSGQDMPTDSSWAEKYSCDAREELPDVVDTKAGYVTASDQSRGPSWGTFARPGVAKLSHYPNCDDGRIVVDIVRINKGHTEGLEPNIVEEIVKLMQSAKGGKLQAN